MNIPTSPRFLLLALTLLTGCSGLELNSVNKLGKATVHLALPEGAQPLQADPIPNEHIVTFRSTVELRKLALPGTLDLGGGQVLVKGLSQDALEDLPGVLEVQPNHRYMSLAMPSDPLLTEPLFPGNPLTRQWALEQVGAPAAWEDTGTSTVIKVAVLDDGYLHHEDLDFSRLDLTPLGCNPSSGAGCLNPADRNDDPYYQGAKGSHGLAVAGVVGATTNNGKGIASLAWNKSGQVPIQVMPIKIFDQNEGSSTFILAQAIRTAIAKGARVINLSLCLTSGRECSDTTTDPVLDQVLQEARDAGVVLVASSGNYQKAFVGYPANSVNAVSVGATNIDRQKAAFSQYGARLRLVAPGDQVLTLQGVHQGNRELQTQYTPQQGTSFSAPLVAGAAGLLFSKRPDATWDQVVGALIHSGEPLEDERLEEARFLRVDRALQETVGNPPPPPPLKGALQALVTLRRAFPDGPPLVGTGSWQERFEQEQDRSQLVLNQKAFSFDSEATSVSVYAQKELKAGTYVLTASVVDRYAAGKVLYRCLGEFTVLPDEVVNTQIECR